MTERGCINLPLSDFDSSSLFEGCNEPKSLSASSARILIIGAIIL